jgi:putative endonuclease
MTKRRQSLGRAGEDCAARFLEERGYRIVARNVRAARVEIDLIAARGSVLVFVEVKSRSASGPDGFGGHRQAAEAVDPRKQARLQRGARAWLAEHAAARRRANHIRFDVITCLHGVSRSRTNFETEAQNDATAPEAARWSIKHWEAAF